MGISGSNAWHGLCCQHLRCVMHFKFSRGDFDFDIIHTQVFLQIGLSNSQTQRKVLPGTSYGTLSNISSFSSQECNLFMALINTNFKKNVFNDLIPGRCQNDKWSPQTSIAHNGVLKTNWGEKRRVLVHLFCSAMCGIQSAWEAWSLNSQHSLIQSKQKLIPELRLQILSPVTKLFPLKLAWNL